MSQQRSTVFRFALGQVIRWPGNPDARYQISQRRSVESRTDTWNEYGLEDLSREGLRYLTWVNEADLEEARP